MQINGIAFKHKTIVTRKDNLKYSKEISSNGVVLKNTVTDLNTDNILLVERFNDNGEFKDILEFSYLPNKKTEHYRSKNQEYTRIITEEIKNYFKHITETYISKTKPENNYVRESIRDLSGKIIQIINNGQKLL